MPFVVRADSTAATADPRRAFVLAPGRLADDRLSIELLSLPASDSIEISTDDGELAWLQVLSGDCRLDADPLTPDCIAMLARGAVATLTADATARVLVARVPRAVDYDDRLARLARVLVDWTTEPVLSSEHDARRRIYLASPRLWGTSAVKGEMIIYPPDSVPANDFFDEFCTQRSPKIITAGQHFAVMESPESLPPNSSEESSHKRYYPEYGKQQRRHRAVLQLLPVLVVDKISDTPAGDGTF